MNYKIILASILMLFYVNLTVAQCIPGIVDAAIWGSPSTTQLGFTVDADITDEDTLQIVQGIDTSVILQYLLPTEQDITTPIVGTAAVTEVQIQGVTGLPVGLNWTLDADATANSNTYYPPTYRFGSVTICGTTFSTPGVKTITVSTLGTGSLSGITQSQPVSFNLYIEVLPGQGGNSAFTVSPPVGCDAMDVDFEAIFVSPDPVLFPVDFAWDFGDGSTGTGTTINAHNYSAPGTYPVKLDVTIYEYFISSVSLSATSGWWGDIEELSSLQNPELYGNILGVSLPEQGSGTSQTWATDIPLTSSTITGQFYDADNGAPFGSPDDDLGLATNSSFIPTAGATPSLSTSNYIAALTLDIRISSTLTFWDTVKVFSGSNATITSTNGTSFCGTDSTLLDVGAGFASIQWYEDTTLLIGETNQTLNVNTAGSYSAVVLANGNICEGTTNTITISVDGIVVPVIMASMNGIEIDNPNGYSVQWYSNGVPIPGATSDELTDLSSGNPFSVVVTNSGGCTATSANYDGCIGGYADAPNGTDVVGSTATTFEAVGFSYNSQSQLAWSVTPVADGMITTEAQVDAINPLQVYLGNGDEIDLLLNCGSLAGPGAYYLTPFLIEAVDLPEFPFPYSDTTCTPTMDLDITFDCATTDWEIGDASVVDPSGTEIDLLSLSPIPINYPIGPDLVCDLLGGTLADVNLFSLAPSSNPNGTWAIEVKNSGSGEMNITVPAFQVTLYAADCSDITSDMVYDYGPYDITIPSGETEAITIQVPPLPLDFPSIASSCSAFGTPVEIDVTDCASGIEDIVDADNISLFPNPNTGKFTLSLDFYETNDMEISIMDVTGRTILNREYNNITGQFNETFNLNNNLKSGFYFMNIKVGNYTIQKKFIVK